MQPPIDRRLEVQVADLERGIANFAGKIVSFGMPFPASEVHSRKELIGKGQWFCPTRVNSSFKGMISFLDDLGFC
jgi:hypothetical protein